MVEDWEAKAIKALSASASERFVVLFDLSALTFFARGAWFVRQWRINPRNPGKQNGCFLGQV
jgi:LAS superfamily LD-carboxypeptidase LdcB